MLAAALRLSPSGEDGGLAVLAQTVTVTRYPSSAGAFYACVPLQVDGAEVEGAAASFAADPARILYACNLGSQIPPEGTKIVLHACGGRWTFRYDG
jgi:hypothetical protein